MSAQVYSLVAVHATPHAVYAGLRVAPLVCVGPGPGPPQGDEGGGIVCTCLLLTLVLIRI